MSRVPKLLLSCVLFGLTASTALADPASPVLNVSGTSSFNTSTLSFPGSMSSLGDTGSASIFSGGSVDYLLGAVSYMGGVMSPIEVFTVSDGHGNTIAFYTAYNGATSGVNPSDGLWTITLDETGYYVVNGGAEMPGYFDVTFTGQSPTGSGGVVPFGGSGSLNVNPGDLPDISFAGSGGFIGTFVPRVNAVAAIAPEPASYVLLGSALFGLFAMRSMRRRRPLHAV
jgi:hypothetical protein